MDKKVYEKTRYQNIYRHRKKKNYLIMISTPAKTSISNVDGKKIFKIEDALKIRDNPKIKLQKGNEAIYKEDFEIIWEKYIDDCIYVKKLAFNTIKRKKKIYNKYISKKINKRLSKITKDDISQLINKMNTTLKEKNFTIKELRAFFNWCIQEDYLLVSPMTKIKKYKVEQDEMKFWTPNEIVKIFDVLNKDIESNNINIVKKARLVKLFIVIGFSLGDRTGETRALTYDCFNKTKLTVRINHSINYDTKSNDFLSNTKNYQSQREVEITQKVINEVFEYKTFLANHTNYDIKDSDIIFFNYKINKPYSDTNIRQKFYYYCEKANVTKIRMYDLRHTYVATMMGEGKELYQISKRIGHKLPSTTLNKYGHLSDQIKREIAQITDKYI